MMPNKDTVKQLLSLSDRELIAAINDICDKNNIDKNKFRISQKEISMLRAVLANASDKDIEKFLSYLGGGKKNG